MAYQIIRDAPPLPPRPSAPGPEPLYPFAEMHLGDAFFIPTDGADVRQVKRRAFWAVQNYRKKGHVDQHFSVRVTDDGRVGVWRVG